MDPLFLIVIVMFAIAAILAGIFFFSMQTSEEKGKEYLKELEALKKEHYKLETKWLYVDRITEMIGYAPYDKGAETVDVIRVKFMGPWYRIDSVGAMEPVDSVFMGRLMAYQKMIEGQSLSGEQKVQMWAYLSSGKSLAESAGSA